MKNYSKSITVYSAQFMSIISIFARISINTMLVALPIVFVFSGILPYEIFFLLKWLMTFSIFYHLFHFQKEVLTNFKGFLGGLMFISGIVGLLFNEILLDIGFVVLLLYLYIYHVSYGFFSLFSDYSITSNSKFRVKDCLYMHIFISFLLAFFTLVVLF